MRKQIRLNVLLLLLVLPVLANVVLFVPSVHAWTPWERQITADAVLMLANSPTRAQGTMSTGDSWTTKLPMPTARYNLGVAVVNGKIYAIGGHYEGSGYLGTNEEYDPATNSWATRASMPTPRACFGIAVWHTKILVIGGYTAYNVMTDVNEIYDPLTDSWETKTSMPTLRAWHHANMVNDKIYLMGGWTPSGSVDVNEVYDPSLDSWTTEAPIPTSVSHFASTALNNKIYLLGGQNDRFDLNQIYAPATNTWDYGMRMPVPTVDAAAGSTTGTVAPKRIYVIGGRLFVGSGETKNHNQVYDPESNNWTMAAPMPTGRFGLGVAVVDDRLYAIGGLDAHARSTTKNEQYTPLQQIPALTVSLTNLNQTIISSGTSVSLQVHVTVGTSAVEDASVQLVSDKGGTFIPQSGYTDSNGYFAVTFTAPTISAQIALTITANATKTGYLNGQSQTQITVNPSQPQPQPSFTVWIYIVVITVVLAIGCGVAIARRRSPNSNKNLCHPPITNSDRKWVVVTDFESS